MPRYKREFTGLFAMRGQYTLRCGKCAKDFEVRSPVFRIELPVNNQPARIWTTCTACSKRGWHEITRYKGPVIYI